MSNRAAAEQASACAITALQLELESLVERERGPCDLRDYSEIRGRMREVRKALAEHKYRWVCADMKDAIKELGDMCRDLPSEEQHALVVDRVMTAQREQRTLLVQMYGLDNF